MTDKLKENAWLSPNQIIQYEGGGYDGCFWEWNFAYIDGDGNYHGIITTGRDGCHTKEELVKKLKEEGDAKMWAADTTNRKELANFMDGINDTFIKPIAEWFDENFPDVVPYTHCEECGALVLAYDTSTTSYRGAGGIAIENVCEDCYMDGTCDGCGEYCGKENIRYFESLKESLCEDCRPEITTIGVLDSISHEVSKHLCEKRGQLAFSGVVDENAVWPVTKIMPYPDDPNAKMYEADDLDNFDAEDDLSFGFLFYLDGIEFYAEPEFDEYEVKIFLNSKLITKVSLI